MKMQGYSTPILSIVIPTRNRPGCLKALISELLCSDGFEFEVVVQDNSDSDELISWIESRNDTRLKYVYSCERISVVENCDRAIRRSIGAFVCMLGDDDGLLLPEVLKQLNVLDDDVDALMGPVLNYVWPDLDHPILRDYGGKIYLRPVKGTSRSIDFKSICRKVVRHGGALGLEDLPCVYHGFIRRSALDRLAKSTGTYFPGSSPDMANAIGICTTLRRLARFDKPLVITGHSRASTAGAGTQKRHHGSISEQAHLPVTTASDWQDSIPKFWSGPTIYADSIASALRRTKSIEFGALRLPPIYAACIVYHREYIPEILRAMSVSGVPAWRLYGGIVFYVVEMMLKRTFGFLRRLMLRTISINSYAMEAKSIDVAIRLVRERQSTRV